MTIRTANDVITLPITVWGTMDVVIMHERFPVTMVGWVAFATATTAVTLIAAESWGAAGVLIGMVVAAGGLAAVVDARSGRLPDRLLALAAVPLIGLLLHEAGTGQGGEALLAAVLGVVACAGPMFLVHVAEPRALGFGDVKLGALLGAALGPIDPRLGLAVVCVAAAATSGVGLARRRESLPLGPGLVLGATVSLVTFGLLDTGVVSWQ